MSLKLADRIEAFSRLGSLMKEACTDKPVNRHAIKLRSLAARQYKNNHWFTPDYVRESISALAGSLDKLSLSSWLKPYSLPSYNSHSRHIAVIMAGNIPLVGFHDFLSVLLSGNIIIVKASTKDRELIDCIASILIEIEPGFKDFISFREKDLAQADAVLATGSNNTSRYFDYTYGHLPHIFRKNRNSVAIVHPGISDSELTKLGRDVFYYYGLGCRNVSRLYLPYDFDINRLGDTWSIYNSHLKIKPYQNNYSYNKALLTVERKKFTDLGYLLLKEDHGFSSPVSVLYYSLYKTIEDVNNELTLNSEKIQAIVGKGYIPFGQAQYPSLNDYADGIDTIDFLVNLS